MNTWELKEGIMKMIHHLPSVFFTLAYLSIWSFPAGICLMTSFSYWLYYITTNYSPIQIRHFNKDSYLITKYCFLSREHFYVEGPCSWHEEVKASNKLETLWNTRIIFADGWLVSHSLYYIVGGKPLCCNYHCLPSYTISANAKS